MCFSFEVSISTFIVTWGISLYLLNKKLDKHQQRNIIFLMILSSIQIVDAVLWYIKMKKNRINYIVTSFILPGILSLQALYNVFIRNDNKNDFISIMTIIGCVYLFYRFNGYSKTLCNNYFASPVWGSNEIKLWEFILFAIFIFYPDWKMLLSITVIGIVVIHIFAGGAYGSLWCAVANMIAFYYLYKY